MNSNITEESLWAVDEMTVEFIDSENLPQYQLTMDTEYQAGIAG